MISLSNHMRISLYLFLVSFSIEYGFTMRSAGFPPLFEYGLSYLAETFKLKSHEPINR